MSLYQFGFKCNNAESSGSSTDKEVPRCMPSLEEAKALGLGEVEHKGILNETSDAVINTNFKKQRVSQRRYTMYLDEDHAKIGKYTLGNGNEQAQKYFLIKYPLLIKNTVRNFKKVYNEKL